MAFIHCEILHRRSFNCAILMLYIIRGSCRKTELFLLFVVLRTCLGFARNFPTVAKCTAVMMITPPLPQHCFGGRAMEVVTSSRARRQHAVERGLRERDICSHKNMHGAPCSLCMFTFVAHLTGAMVLFCRGVSR